MDLTLKIHHLRWRSLTRFVLLKRESEKAAGGLTVSNDRDDDLIKVSSYCTADIGVVRMDKTRGISTRGLRER